MNFWLNPQQAFKVRQDQYWLQQTGPIGVGDWGQQYLDARGNTQSIATQQQYVAVTVYQNDSRKTDSNDYYFVKSITPWGDGLAVQMRLASDIEYIAGDTVMCCYVGITYDSPDSSDDGFLLVEPISKLPENFLIQAKLVTREAYNPGPPAQYQYGWHYLDGLDTVGGTVAAHVEITHDQIADGLNPDIFTLTITGTTGGTYTLTEDGTTTDPIAFDADASDIEGELTSLTVSGLGPFTITGTDGSTHTLIVSGTELQPKVAHNPAVFMNPETPMCVPVRVWLRKVSGSDPTNKIVTTQMADPEEDLPMIWQYTRKNLIDGTVDFTFDMLAPISVEWNDNAAALALKLSDALSVTVTGPVDNVFTITMTADDNVHTLTLDDHSFGTKVYKVIWSNPNECCIYGGVFLPLMPGYPTIPIPTVTIDPPSTDGASAGPWTITVSADAASGTYEVVVDGGDPVSVSPGTCPDLGAGFVVVHNMDGTCTITAVSGTHTIAVYGATLRGVRPPVIPSIDGDGCFQFLQLGVCTP